MGYPTYRAGPFDYGRYGPAEDEYGVQSILDQAFEESHTDSLENGFVVYSKTIRLNKKGDSKTIYLYFPNTEHTLTHGGRSAVTQSELARAHIGSFTEPSGKWGEWFNDAMSRTESKVIEMLESDIKATLGDEVKKARRRYREVLNKPSVKRAIAKQKEKIEAATKRVVELTNFRNSIETQIRQILRTDYHALADRSGIRSIRDYSTFTTKAKLANSERLKSLRSTLSETKDALRNARSDAAHLRREEREIRPREFARYAGDEIENIIADINEKLEKVEPGSIAEKDLVAVRRAVQRPFSMGFGMDKAVEKAAQKARDLLHSFLIGSKAPPLSERTIKYRDKMGFDHTPLKETEEWANSLKWDVK